MTAKNLLVLVDADSLIYLAGVAGQELSYHAVLEDSIGNTTQGIFTSAADLNTYCAERQLALLDRETVIKPLPVEYSLSIVKKKLKEIQSRYGKRMRVYIKSAEGKNFRDEMYTVQKYKGNRNSPKPIHYEAIVEYMVGFWDAIRIDGKEVDDQVALDAAESSIPYVVCSPDKDLDQIPGLHWNYKNAVEYEVTEFEAKRFFWIQVLMGDAADNILGCWKVGEGKAVALIDEWASAFWENCADPDMTLEEWLWKEILVKYEESLEHPACPYKHMEAYDVALQTAQAVWMQTERNVLWSPPGDPKITMQMEEDPDDWLEEGN